ncbi:SAF domain-containing protein [Streptomyces sp. NPDC014685]|uniref:SAF domain-containing protein n=1 Tax=Streptomyces sp. NPDC014685 TaxID=3364881 RepID=UPI0036F6185C
MDTTTPAPPPIAVPRQTDLPVSAGAKKSSRAPRKVAQALAWTLAALVGALVAISMVNRAGDRVEVLAVARDVQAGQVVEASDVTTAQVAEDPALTPVPAADQDRIVGRRAAVDLRRGSLLTDSSVQSGGGLGDDLQVVGVEVKKGTAPRDELRPGDEVLAVVLPEQGAPSAAGTGAAKGGAGQVPESIEATVKSVSRPDATGSLVVNLAVATTDGPQLAEKAAAKRIALVRQPRDGKQ